MQGCQASYIMHLGQHTGCALAVVELVPCFDRNQPHEGSHLFSWMPTFTWP